VPVTEKSGCVFVQIDFVSSCHDFPIGIVAACATHVVGALQLAAVGALVRVCRNQRIMGAAVIAARFRNFVLLDGHVATSIPVASSACFTRGCGAHTRALPMCPTLNLMKAGKYFDFANAQAVFCLWRKCLLTGLFPVCLSTQQGLQRVSHRHHSAALPPVRLC